MRPSGPQQIKLCSISGFYQVYPNVFPLSRRATKNTFEDSIRTAGLLVTRKNIQAQQQSHLKQPGELETIAELETIVELETAVDNPPAIRSSNAELSRISYVSQGVTSVGGWDTVMHPGLISVSGSTKDEQFSISIGEITTPTAIFQPEDLTTIRPPMPPKPKKKVRFQTKIK
jgi:hypothetical protein